MGRGCLYFSDMNVFWDGKDGWEGWVVGRGCLYFTDMNVFWDGKDGWWVGAVCTLVI